MTEYGNGGSFTVTMDGPFSGGGGDGTVSKKLITIYTPASKWKGGTSPFSQTVEVNSINVNNQVDLQLSAAQIEQLSDQTIAFTAENNGGVVTVYAIGDKPAINVNFQATLSEVVNVTGNEIKIIRGNTVSTNMPRANYNQTDESKADYINNKPDEKINEALDKARNSLPRAGGTMAGNINMDNHVVENVPAPTQNHHATNKDYVDNLEKYYQVTLKASGWSDKKITIDVENVISDSAKCNVMVAADPEEENFIAYGDSVVRCMTQGEGTLTFACVEVPEKDLKVNVSVRRIT